LHEFSITSQVVRSVLEEAEKRGAKRVKEVHLVVGSLTLLGIDQVRFSYDILVKNTIAKGSRLFIRRRKGRVECGSCGYRGPVRFRSDPIYHISLPTLSCPQCGCSVKVVEGKECLIRSIKMVV
jgi:hydrogenase nickel incorporation protein HypA/HybF